MQAAHVAFLDEGAFDAWNEPTALGNRRLAGVDLNKVRNRHALNTFVELSTQPNGFTLDQQLTTVVRARSVWSAEQYSTRNAAYDLAKLRGKMLVQPVEHSRRYRADPSGVRIMCVYLVLRDKVIKPLLAGVVRPLGRPPKNISPLDKHYLTLRDKL